MFPSPPQRQRHQGIQHISKSAHSQPYSYSTAPPLSLFPNQALVLPSRRLARLELIQIPPADAQAPLVLIHAPAEAGHVLGARAALRLLARGVHLVRVLELGGGGGRLRGRAAAAAGEPAAHRVADRGAHCHSAVDVLALEKAFLCFG